MASSSSHLPKNDLLSPPSPPPLPQQPPSHHHLPLKKPTDSITTKKRKLQTSATTTTTINSNDNDILFSSFEDLSLSTSSHLTRQELLRRRLHRLHRLDKVYRDHYWALMEDLRVQYREYYWKYGVSPCKDEEERESGGCGGGGGGERELYGLNSNAEGCGESNNNNNGGGSSSCVIGGNSGGKLGLGFRENDKEVKLSGNNRCALVSCKLKAMALTSFCYLHILSDPQQQLYKACNAIIKIAQQGPILCGRPILKSTIPSLCNIHFPKTQKDVKHALKKAGLNVSSSSKLAPKFHAIIAEYVQLIQSKRRAAEKNNRKCVVVKEEPPS